MEGINLIDAKDLEHYNSHDVFLDNSTGDYYSFKKDQGMWVPIGNIGLHYSKAAELEGTEDTLMARSQVYCSRLSSYSAQKVITSKISERC